uniref:Large ribosomal subunit protein uL22c n=1 Tax=Monomorphina aenigmatica TaxID=304863 RepID=L0BGJ4_MONAE|nr:ribosomal protein L22 [Monomorphina aenigmatica]AFZ88812.1 ribosomal protein L22 [Monomorphina aenigmatica]
MENLKNIEGIAYSRYVRISPFKIRRILDQIRGHSYSEALIILKFMPYKACLPILKVLTSAASNLKSKFDIKDSFIYITEARADGGPILKRFRPHAQGRGFPIKKYMSHIVSLVYS